MTDHEVMILLADQREVVREATLAEVRRERFDAVFNPPLVWILNVVCLPFAVLFMIPELVQKIRWRIRCARAK